MDMTHVAVVVESSALMPKFASVDDYLASLPAEQREVVEEIERRVMRCCPAQIGDRYDMPTWQVEGVSLVHVAAWKQHVSLYPGPPAGDPIWTPTSRRTPERKARSSCRTPIDYALIERVVRRLLETRSSK